MKRVCSDNIFRSAYAVVDIMKTCKSGRTSASSNFNTARSAYDMPGTSRHSRRLDPCGRHDSGNIPRHDVQGLRMHSSGVGRGPCRRLVCAVQRLESKTRLVDASAVFWRSFYSYSARTNAH